MKLNSLFFLVATAVLISVSGCKPQTTRQVNDYSDTIDLLLNAPVLLNIPTEKVFNGCVLISSNGETKYSKIMGYGDIESKSRLDSNSQFIIGSISKQITAVIVLQEVDKGRLKLDVPIHHFLPELTQGWADTVTVHHLLTHMHGIQSPNEPALFKAGTQFNYGTANTGYGLLSRIVEKTSGQTFEALSSALFAQCGMINSCHPDSKKYPHLVKGYTEQSNKKLAFDSTSFINHPAAGGFISTPADLVLWNNHLHQGKLLKPETYASMITKQKNAIRQHPIFGRIEYGYGITVNTKDSITQLGQTGFAPGFISMNFYFPATKTSVVVLENTVFDSDNLSKAFKYHVTILNLMRGSSLIKKKSTND